MNSLILQASAECRAVIQFTGRDNRIGSVVIPITHGLMPFGHVNNAQSLLTKVRFAMVESSVVVGAAVGKTLVHFCQNCLGLCFLIIKIDKSVDTAHTAFYAQRRIVC